MWSYAPYFELRNISQLPAQMRRAKILYNVVTWTSSDLLIIPLLHVFFRVNASYAKRLLHEGSEAHVGTHPKQP